MTNLAAGTAFSGFALVLAWLLALHLVLGQPLLGRWSHARFTRALTARPYLPARPRLRPSADAARLLAPLPPGEGPGPARDARRPGVDRAGRARLRRYRRTAVTEWLLALVVLALLALAPGLTAARLGLGLPRLDGGHGPYTVIGSIGLLATVGVYVGVRRRLHAPRAAEEEPLAGPEAVLALLPRTVPERRAFAGLALTAGVCEEVLYRGFLIAGATALWPGIGPWRLVLLSAACFGAAHLYQGPWGILGTGVVGGCLAVLHLGTQSLLLPVCYHALLDLRILLLPVDAATTRGARHRA